MDDDRQPTRPLTEPQLLAIMTAVAVLRGDGATAIALELLLAFGCRSHEAAAILRLCQDGRKDDGLPILREASARVTP